MDNKRKELTPRRCFRCKSEDLLIAKFPNPPKDNDKWQNQVRLSKIVNRALQKECNNGDNKNDQNIYAYMSCMSNNDKSSSRNFSDSLKLTNWILDSVATCHMMPQVSDFIPGSLEDTDKHIEVSDGYHITAK